jgi:hypothetical protein
VAYRDPQPEDLTTVRRRVREVWAEPVAEVWMVSANAHLGGARPVDVLALSGPAEVLAALDAVEAGGYA